MKTINSGFKAAIATPHLFCSVMIKIIQIYANILAFIPHILKVVSWGLLAVNKFGKKAVFSNVFITLRNLQESPRLQIN